MKNPTLEEAKEIVKEYPCEDYYVQAHYSQGLSMGGEHWDNTIDTSYYWRQCYRQVVFDASKEHIQSGYNPSQPNGADEYYTQGDMERCFLGGAKWQLEQPVSVPVSPINMNKEQIIEGIQQLLERPDMLIDAISNEDSDWNEHKLYEDFFAPLLPAKKPISEMAKDTERLEKIAQALGSHMEVREAESKDSYVDVHFVGGETLRVFHNGSMRYFSIENVTIPNALQIASLILDKYQVG